jgi:prepilin-type N-terminal cleavage/methylation domain-containing protein
MNTRGFTLIELLICVAVLAILACIAYVSYEPFMEKVRAIAPYVH